MFLMRACRATKCNRDLKSMTLAADYRPRERARNKKGKNYQQRKTESVSPYSHAVMQCALGFCLCLLRLSTAPIFLYAKPAYLPLCLSFCLPIFRRSRSKPRSSPPPSAPSSSQLHFLLILLAVCRAVAPLAPLGVRADVPGQHPRVLDAHGPAIVALLRELL